MAVAVSLRVRDVRRSGEALAVQVIAQLRGELPLPWEQDTDEGNRNKLGAFKGPVLQLLQRDPARRVSMRRFHDVCSRLFASRTAEAQEDA